MRLDRVPILRALVALVETGPRTIGRSMRFWPSWASNYFQPEWPEWQSGEAAIDLERAIRKLQIPHGQETLLKELGRRRRTDFQSVEYETELESAEKSEEELPEDHESSTGQIENLSYELRDIEASGRRIRCIARKGHAFRLGGKPGKRLARQTGMLRDIECGNRSGRHPCLPKNRTSPAWNFLMSVLSSGDRLAGWLKQRPPELSREKAFRTLNDILGSERLPAGDDESGPRPRAFGVERAVAAYSLFVFGGPFRKGVSPARPRRSAV